MIRVLERWREGRATEAPEPRRPEVPAGCRVYAIGDIHGRDDLLRALLEQVRQDAANYSGTRQLVFLGDYVDRGPHSRLVLDLLLEAIPPGFEAIFLKGNHEQALLDFLAYPEAAVSWLSFGGRETLASYGVPLAGHPDRHKLQAAARLLAEALPPAHREFLEAGWLSWTRGDYHFVHAGIRPGVPLERQHADDLMWIRDEFTTSTRDHGVVVVHGHTISANPELRSNRIGIDTGAFYSNVLTCLALEGTERRFLQTSARDAA